MASLDSSAFKNTSLVSWIQAIVRPHIHLAIPNRETFDFQIIVVIILDQTWFVRNQLIHNNITADIQITLKLIANTVKEHLTAWKNSPQGQTIWQSPPLGALKVNFNVAIRPLFSVAAAVLSNSNEVIISAITKKLPLHGCKQRGSKCSIACCGS
ncbi:hypothetical protein SLA2020_347210 [Shorea laevis]